MAKTNDAISFLDIISHKYDVVVANPPYTAAADFGQELKQFIDSNYSKPLKFNKNLYASFVKRCCELANEEGKIGMIHPLTFMYIKDFEDVRKYILDNTTINIFVEHGADSTNMFSSVSGFASAPAYYCLDKGLKANDSLFISLDQYTRTPEEKNKKKYCLLALADEVNKNPNKNLYYVSQLKLKEIKSWPFIYWISDDFRKKFASESLDSVMDNKQGLASGLNERFLRFWWEEDNKAISTIHGDNKKWIRYSKGGPFNKWYGNLWVLVNWEKDGYEIKHFVNEKGKLKSRPQNESYYFREGITYSALGFKVSFRYLPTNFMFDVGGSTTFSNKYKNLNYSMAFLNTLLVRYICRCLNPTVNTNQGDLDRVPFVIPDKESESLLENLAKQNVSIKKHLCEYSLIEFNFTHSPIGTSSESQKEIAYYFNYENALLTQILLNEAIINKVVFDVYELSEHDKQMVLDKEGIPVGDLPVSHEAKVAYKQWLMLESEFKPANDVLEHLENLEECDDLPKITDFDTLYQNNNEWEEFCIKRNVNPVEAWWQFKNANVLPPQRTQVLAFELITDVIRTVLAKDDDGIIPLGDRLGEERLAIRIEKEMMERAYSAAQFSQVCQLLGCPLEKYLQERFFQQLSDHLNLFMYLPKTPFIWHLSSGPHHAIELYVSIYKWSRDTLYRVRSIYAANREAALRDRLNSIDTSNTEGRMEAQELRATLTELQEFCQKVDDLLATGYDPKLDDGVGKNIAPLQKRKMLSYEVLNAGQLKKYLNADW